MDTSPIQPATIKQLSCVTCRQRKVKCDNVQPCSSCRRSKVECQFRDPIRVPKVKKQSMQARDSELLRRVNRLESLIGEVNAVKVAMEKSRDSAIPVELVQAPASAAIQNRPHPGQTSAPCGWVGGKQIQFNDFWSSLCAEVGGLRDLLEHPSDSDEDTEYPMSNSGAKEPPPSYVVFGDQDTLGYEENFQPSDHNRILLFSRYFSNFHPVCTVLHRPTITIALLGDITTPGLVEHVDRKLVFMELRAKKALELAVYFAALITMSPRDCVEHFGEEQDILIARYRRCTELALNHAHFLSSMDFITLQAFTIYLVQ